MVLVILLAGGDYREVGDFAEVVELTVFDLLDLYGLEDFAFLVEALDVSGASRSNCANVQLYQSNGTGAQRWIVSHDGQGYVTLRNAASGKVLDIAGASTANGANVQQYDSNGTWAQKWIAVSNGDGTVTLHSALKYGLVLDVSGASTANGANVQVYASNGTRAQRWVRK